MKLTLKSNGKITRSQIREFSRNGEDVCTKKTAVEGEIYDVEVDFEPCALFSDIEIWLTDENDNYCDHIALNVSKRKKILAHK